MLLGNTGEDRSKEEEGRREEEGKRQEEGREEGEAVLPRADQEIRHTRNFSRKNFWKIMPLGNFGAEWWGEVLPHHPVSKEKETEQNGLRREERG